MPIIVFNINIYTIYIITEFKISNNIINRVLLCYTYINCNIQQPKDNFFVPLVVATQII